MRILIVEDEPGPKLLRRSLEQLGHECVHAESGEEAWDLFDDVKPDLVISDLEKPRIDGLDLLRRVRAARTDQYVLFLMAVPEAKNDELRRPLDAGADDFFTKPVTTEELEARIMVAEQTIALHRRLKEKKYDLERLNQELYEENRRDLLTRVGNRLRLEEDLDALAGRARRYGHGFSVLLCDIDDFTAYNETCGHRAGDDTLRTVARTISSYGRSGDMAYRFSGEEFMVVLPEQPLERAVIAAERRRVAVEKLGVPNPASGSGVITMSTGVAAFDPDDANPVEGLLARARQALELAKANGKNQVYIHEHDRRRSLPPTGGRPSSSPP